MTPEITSSQAWAGTMADLRAASCLHPALYTDPVVHDTELDRVFHRAWVCVALTDELRTPGTVLVRTVGARSVLVTVDADHRPHGFINACRHRGTELAAGDCTVRSAIRCPYHRWGYALDGRLVSTPGVGPDDDQRLERDELGLLPVRVDTWGCLVFACLHPATPPLPDWLGDLPQRLAGYQLDTWTRRETQEVDIAANWKLITENFQECYHLPWVHPSLATVSRVDDHYPFQGSGMYCGQTTTPVSDADGDTWLRLPPKEGLDPDDAISGRHIAIFPNVMMSILPNHLFVMRLEPRGPDGTRETCTWLLPDRPAGGIEGVSAAFASTRDFWVEVNAQDIDIVERSQRGLTRGAVHPGPLVARFEQPLHRFHRMLADLCTADDPSAITIPVGSDGSCDAADRADAPPTGGTPEPA